MKKDFFAAILPCDYELAGDWHLTNEQIYGIPPASMTQGG